MKVSVCTIGTSRLDRRDQQLPDPVHLEDLLGDDRAAEDRRDASAMTVTTGIIELRSTWTRTTTPFRSCPWRGRCAHNPVEVVEHRGAHEAADLGVICSASTITGMIICWSWKTKLSQSSTRCVVS
jgi:hypothetical protein